MATLVRGPHAEPPRTLGGATDSRPRPAPCRVASTRVSVGASNVSNHDNGTGDAGAGEFRRARSTPAGCHLLRRRPGDHRRLGRSRRPDHRDRCGQGAGRRGARRVADAGRPDHAHPGIHRCSHRHHRPDGRWFTTDGHGAAHIPGLCSRLRAGRPQRPLRCWLPSPRRRPAGSPVAGLRGHRHRHVGPPGCHPRRGAELQARNAGQGVPSEHVTDSPCT